MSKVWLTMKNLEKHICSLRNHVFKLTHNVVTLVEENFYSWWRMMTMDHHHAAAMLNSYLLDDLSIHENTAAKLGFLDANRKLAKIPLNFGLVPSSIGG